MRPGGILRRLEDGASLAKEEDAASFKFSTLVWSQ